MTTDEIKKMVYEAYTSAAVASFTPMTDEALERFAALVAEKEREAIMDEWWMCVQSDLENGVKSLNERAAEKWKKEYPQISKFAETIEGRGK